jgi:hypothetical protein
MTRRSDRSFPVFDILAIPYNFLSGYFVGLVAPVAAIAAIVAGIRFLTGRVPYLGSISEDEDGGRRLSLSLMTPEEVKEQFEEQKVLIGGELGKMRDEIQAIIEEAQVEAAEATNEEGQEAPAEA